MSDPKNTIAFQGVLGAFSHMASKAAMPEMAVLPCASFEEMLDAVKNGDARFAMVPVENSVAGRVADIHHLLPESGLHIIGEHFQRIELALLAPRGTKIESLKRVRSHSMALAQCRKLIRELKLQAVASTDTAGAAAELADLGDPECGALASPLAAEIYDLDILRRNVEDATHNTTRFLIMAREGIIPAIDSGTIVTTIVFAVRSVPAALYKALGGFATNGVNLTKLESYMVGGSFEAAQFYVDAEGHPEQHSMQLALEELKFFCPKGAVKILGVYPADPYRVIAKQNGA
ncbi:MAG: prephenate dehydratase [Alphaproteobacteria bacterium]|nr:prephenate dehydratase [Alphaproteobacteria bacterium]MBU0888649.1 prephenate dehydratase [Alphaproteobacteria bacterium]MBU1813617.1 prephenate dehydratase [Alphaproteobacteria bacterium]MBU2091926.1 prephenate dehydratase [Alphaproteobacteria bacterium]